MEKKELSTGEAAAVGRLWRKPVKLFHPDRCAHEPEKQETYHKLTAAIHHAKDRGDLATLRSACWGAAAAAGEERASRWLFFSCAGGWLERLLAAGDASPHAARDHLRDEPTPAKPWPAPGAPNTSLDKASFAPSVRPMPTPKKQHASSALSRDLTQPGSKGLIKVSDDPARKTFTASKDGAVWVFAHKQPDPAYWSGVKHYGSGPSSKIRIRRTQAVGAA